MKTKIGILVRVEPALKEAYRKLSFTTRMTKDFLYNAALTNYLKPPKKKSLKKD